MSEPIIYAVGLNLENELLRRHILAAFVILSHYKT